MITFTPDIIDRRPNFYNRTSNNVQPQTEKAPALTQPADTYVSFGNNAEQAKGSGGAVLRNFATGIATVVATLFGSGAATAQTTGGAAQTTGGAAQATAATQTASTVGGPNITVENTAGKAAVKQSIKLVDKDRVWVRGMDRPDSLPPNFTDYIYKNRSRIVKAITTNMLNEKGEEVPVLFSAESKFATRSAIDDIKVLVGVDKVAQKVESFFGYLDSKGNKGEVKFFSPQLEVVNELKLPSVDRKMIAELPIEQQDSALNAYIKANPGVVVPTKKYVTKMFSTNNPSVVNALIQCVEKKSPYCQLYPALFNTLDNYTSFLEFSGIELVKAIRR